MLGGSLERTWRTARGDRRRSDLQISRGDLEVFSRSPPSLVPVRTAIVLFTEDTPRQGEPDRSRP
jgi:hypothetical protein